MSFGNSESCVGELARVSASIAAESLGDFRYRRYKAGLGGSIAGS